MKIDKAELKIVFMGTSGAGSVTALNTIRNMGINVVGVLDNYRKIRKMSKYDEYARRKSVLKMACGSDISYLGTDNVNSKEVEEWLIQLGCNLICVCSAFQLMKSNIINIPRYGVINAHGSLLPDYRGPNPPYWCFRNREKWAGTTLHFINEGEDTGDIITQYKYEIPFGMTMQEYMQAQYNGIEKCYQDGLTMLIDGTMVVQKQETPKRPKARNVKREDYLLDYGEWEVEHAYHFLNGTDGINQIYASLIYIYYITGYKKTVQKSGQAYAIQCRDGYIEVERKVIKPVKLIKQFVKKVMSYL